MSNESRAGFAVRAPWRTGAAGLAWCLAGAAAAQTPPGSGEDARTRALEAEVRELTAEVRDLAAQVRELKAQKAADTPQGPPPSPARTAQAASPPAAAPSAPARPAAADAPPRLAQNSPGEPPPAGPLRPYGKPRTAESPTAHRLFLGSLDRYWIGPTANLQFDAGAYVFHPDSPFAGPQALSNGVNARRARLGVVGGLPGGWGYAFVYDAGNSQDSTPRGIETLQVVYGGLRGAAFEIGYSDTYFTLDQATRSRDLLFLERSSASNIATSFNSGDFRSNVGTRVFGRRYWAGAYLTGPAVGDSHTQSAERFGAFERVTVQALQGEQHSLHLGFGFDQLIQAPNSGPGTPNSLTLSDQPELRIDPTVLLNTGAMGSTAHPATGGLVYDLETAATYRGLMWQGEYYRYLVNRAGLPNADFSGWYGQVAWTITGETHGYDEQAGSYFRVLPAHPFDPAKGQWGAWEIAARLDNVDLNSRFTPGVALAAAPAAVDGGVQRGLTVGLNWYPSDFLRFLLDWIHIDYDKANGAAVAAAPLGAPVGARFDAVALRSQVAF